MPYTTEQSAVLLLNRGDSEGLKQLYYIYCKQLFYLAKKYLKDTHLAEDAVQDVFIKLWLKRGKLDPEQCIKSFLFTCLKNHVLNMIRNQKRRIIAAYQVEEQFHPSSDYTADELQYREYTAILNNGINDLPEKRREIFYLKTSGNLSNEQIAEKLHISVNTVKVHYQKGRKFIQAHLQKEAGVSYYS